MQAPVYLSIESSGQNDGALRVNSKGLLLLAMFSACQCVGFSRNLHQSREQATQRHLLQASDQHISFGLATASCEDVFSIIPKARESQSCSIGATKGFVGPLNTWVDVKIMLRARSFKGEVIVTHETRTDVAAQWVWRALRAGYAHTVVVTRGEHSCIQLSKLFGSGEVGCVWFPRSVSYSAARAAAAASAPGLPPPVLDPGQLALFLDEPIYWRLQLVAMVLRLGGYNVLALDTDVVFQDDLYWWMQQPEYKDYQLLVQRDVTGFPNPGVLYVRGASPSGPTSWAIAEALLRNIRWLEQPQLAASFNSSFSTCYDQAVLTDSIYSALVGRPIFPRCLQARPLDITWGSRDDGKKMFQEANEKLIGPALLRKSYPMSRPGPACQAPIVSPEGLWGAEGQLKMPHFGGHWPSELGGRALGELGLVARGFLQMLKEAGCLHGPIHVERPGHAHVNPHPAARMLLSYELDYLIRKLPQEERSPEFALKVPPGADAGPDGVYNVTLAQVSEQLARIPPDRPVVWMERPMRVVDLSGPSLVALQQWVTHCCGLSWPRSRNHICFGDF